MRKLLLALSAALAVCSGSAAAFGRPFITRAQLAVIAKAEEKLLPARIGIAALDSQGRIIAAWRGAERFPLNSTHKAFLCGALLRQAAAGKFALNERVRFGKSRLVAHSPITEKFTAPAAMDWRQICSAAVSFSDNTAANLLSEKLGGPAGLNRFLRSIGDNSTRLDRFEPELNSAIPGDRRDTTTPIAAAKTLQKLVLGQALPLPARQELTGWLKADAVAGALLRASLPQGWQIADKSGAGGYGSRSIIAVIWPKKGAPPVLAIYITQTPAGMAESDAAIARIGAKLFAALHAAGK